MASPFSRSEGHARERASAAGQPSFLRRELPPGEDGSGRAVEALTDVSRQLAASRDLPDFFGRMSRSVAAILPCSRTAFWMLDAEAGLLRVQPEAYGLPFGSHLAVPCRSDGDGAAERVVLDDWTLLGPVPAAGPGAEDPLFDLLQRIGSGNAVVVAWRAGDRVLGAVSAFDSRSPNGFTSQDAQLLRILGLAAGLAWERRQSEESVIRRRDVETSRLRAEAQRMTSLEQVKSDFLKLASHELRAPVAVLRGYLSMMTDGSLGEIGNSRMKSLLPMLEAKVQEIDTLVGEMLETARLEDQRLYLRKDQFDLRDVVRDVVRAGADDRDDSHPVATLMGRSPALIEADRERIAMIVSNLLDNAIKYSPGGGDIDIECEAHDEGGVAVVTVSDHGLGIAEEDLPRLFTRFGRISTAETASIPGTGLGLYLARELARMHGGELTADSMPGEGTTFRLTLPLPRS